MQKRSLGHLGRAAEAGRAEGNLISLAALAAYQVLQEHLSVQEHLDEHLAAGSPAARRPVVAAAAATAPWPTC